MCVKDEDLAIPLVLGLPGLKGTAPNATDPFSLSVWNQQKGTSSSWDEEALAQAMCPLSSPPYTVGRYLWWLKE